MTTHAWMVFLGGHRQSYRHREQGHGGLERRRRANDELPDLEHTLSLALPSILLL